VGNQLEAENNAREGDHSIWNEQYSELKDKK